MSKNRGQNVRGAELLEMAAEQFANLLWKQWLYKKDLGKVKSQFFISPKRKHNVNGKSN